MIQNQHGAGKIARKWDKTGLVLEDMGFNKYRIKVDGSGRVTDRNRQYLRQFTPVTTPQPGPRPDTSFAPKPVAEPDHQPVVEPNFHPVEPLPQQVEIIPDTTVPDTPIQVAPRVDPPSTPESPVASALVARAVTRTDTTASPTSKSFSRIYPQILEKLQPTP